MYGYDLIIFTKYGEEEDNINDGYLALYITEDDEEFEIYFNENKEFIGIVIRCENHLKILKEQFYQEEFIFNPFFEGRDIDYYSLVYPVDELDFKLNTQYLY